MWRFLYRFYETRFHLETLYARGHLRLSEVKGAQQEQLGGAQMIGLMSENLQLVMFFLLMGTII